MRAAYDDAEPAITRLRCAAQMASEQGSAALLRRCERDLAARGVRPAAASVPPFRLTPRARHPNAMGTERS